jgi:hypothetical protein
VVFIGIMVVPISPPPNLLNSIKDSVNIPGHRQGPLRVLSISSV